MAAQNNAIRINYIKAKTDNTQRIESVGYMGSGRGQGKLCYRFLSDSILRLFYSYPTLSCWCNSLKKKAPKEFYERRQQQIRDEDLKNFFPFISWVQQPWVREFSLNTMEVVESPSQGV